MTLTQEQVRQFHEEGWLFLPETFSPEEIAVLREESENIYREHRPEVWREKSGAPRTAFAAHLYNEAFRLLGAHPRMIRPIEQIFGEKLYMHQYKINAKAAFTGEVWQWHQDYGTWLRDDGMPEPRAMNIAVFLDEKVVTELVKEGGIVAPTGKAGGLLMFHGNLVHGSAPNITPYPRRIVYLTLCAVSNYIRKPTRPEWIAHRDFTPIEPVADDALLNYACAHSAGRRAAAE